METLSKPPIATPVSADSPEAELICCCARSQMEEAIAARIKVLLQKVDWVKVIQLAFRHGMMPLLYWHLKAICPDEIPEAILVQLRSYFQSGAQRNLLQTGELLKVLSWFKQHDLPVIAFKGPMLASAMYGNLALRQFTDLDLYVDDRHITKARELLSANGYQLEKELGWEHPFINLANQVKIDLHQAIAPKFFTLSVNFEQLWLRTSPINLAGKKVASFSPEDLLHILCIQWGKDCCQQRVRLAQLCDVAEVLRTYPNLNWFWLLEQCQQSGTERMLLLTLWQTHDLLEMPLPELILNKIVADPVVADLAKEVRSWLWSDESVPTVEEDTFWSFLWLYNHRFYLKLRERLSDKLTYCRYWLRDFLYFALIPNAKDAAIVPLPKFLGFLYYPLHVLRLIRKHGLSWL
jgi:hypothetical protein